MFAFDHRSQMEEMEGATREKIEQLKEHCLNAARSFSAANLAMAFCAMGDMAPKR